MKTETENLRELDAWIAEHVMGWAKRDVAPTKRFPDGFKNAWINPEGGATFLPCYTTDPAAAMQVLEKCLEKIGVVEMWQAKAAPFKFEICAKYVVDLEAEEKTLPLAICKFAKALYAK